MKESPILFSAPMVRAILGGRKTQTRRVFKIRGVDGGQYAITSPAEEVLRFDDGTFHYRSTGALSGPYPCPYGQPGDHLWVREAFGYEFDAPLGTNAPPSRVIYRADAEHADKIGWSPSIHMPRVASRILLEITDVRVQRVQGISQMDALDEGIDTDGDDYNEGERLNSAGSPVSPERFAFAQLWDSINGARGLGWDSNPWVWALTFKRVEQPV